MEEKRFLQTDNYGHKDKFEIVKEFPKDYIIWNIGRQHFPFAGYLPLARPHDTLPYHIDRNSLKTIRVNDAFAEWLLKLVGKGTYGDIGYLEFETLKKKFSLSK